MSPLACQLTAALSPAAAGGESIMTKSPISLAALQFCRPYGPREVDPVRAEEHQVKDCQMRPLLLREANGAPGPPVTVAS